MHLRRECAVLSPCPLKQCRFCQRCAWLFDQNLLSRSGVLTHDYEAASWQREPSAAEVVDGIVVTDDGLSLHRLDAAGIGAGIFL